MAGSEGFLRADQVHRIMTLERLGGVQAIFTGRSGGVSQRWRAGLNWSYSAGDDPAAVLENRHRTLALLGLSAGRAVMGGLVHGDRVVAVQSSESEGQDQVKLIPDCDALITDLPALALVVTAADCVPVYFYDPIRRAVGVAHAGWRGTVAGIAGQTLQAMIERYGCKAADLQVAIGPSIGPCCYEVDGQVADPVRAFYGEAGEALLEPVGVAGKYRLNLWAANRLDLLNAGAGHIHTSGVCTACQVGHFFSHRAEQGGAGRGAALISLTPKGTNHNAPTGSNQNELKGQ